MADLPQSQGRSISCFAEHGKRIQLGKFGKRFLIWTLDDFFTAPAEIMNMLCRP